MKVDFAGIFSDFSSGSATAAPRPLVAAEIGSAHNGDLSAALELTDAAAEAGADILKTQVIFAEEILPPQAGEVPLPGGKIQLYSKFKKLEQSLDFYRSISDHARKKGMTFLASPFGRKSFDILMQTGVGAWKIASPELNHEPLLKMAAESSLPVILSTGVSRLCDIERALEVINSVPVMPAGKDRQDNYPVILLHCITSYPAPPEQANLKLISTLSSIFGLPAGLSDHTEDPVLVPSLASAMGAVLIEKHMTLDSRGKGLDDPVALTPDKFSQMCKAVHNFAPAQDIQKSLEPEIKRAVDHAVQELSQEYGKDIVAAALGDGVKRLAPAEKENYGRTNRSLHAVGKLEKGTIITPENTAILRTEKILRPGVQPLFAGMIYGRTLVRDMDAGQGITWNDVR